MLAVWPINTPAQDEYRLPPVDEADRDLALVEYRDELKKAVQFREPESLVNIVYQQISNGKDVPRGITNFVQYWKADAQNSEVWDVLDNILNLGGGFVRSERGVKFCAPYVYTHFPSELDVFGHVVVLEDNVPLKADPSNASNTVQKLSYHILKVNDWRSVVDKNNPSISWLNVATFDGKTGYVEKRYVRSPSDYHACFLLFERGWRLVSLVDSD